MFTWYCLFNNDEFLATGYISFMSSFLINGFQEKTFLICRGVTTSVLYEDHYLVVGLNGRNPFRFNDHAIFLDDNNDVWLGIYSEN